MDDLISEFITETVESLSALDDALVNLERDPQNAAILGNIFRIMHTIKGTCGFLGLPRLESVAHASENVLGKIRDKILVATPQAITLILESLDNIKSLIDYLSQHGSEQAGDDKALIARLNHFADTGAVMDGAAVPPVANGANGAAHPVSNGVAADVEFPFFRGDDEMEVKAAPVVAPVAEKPVEAPKVEKPVPTLFGD